MPTTSGSWGLVFGGTTQTTATNNIGTITLGTMSFTNNGSAGNTAAFTLSGSTLALNNATIIASATTAGAAITDTIGNALSLTGSNAANFGSGHSITISGNISGSGGLTKSGLGSLFLTGSNSQSGTTYITDGNVRTGAGGASSSTNNYALGTGDVVVSGSGSLAVRNSSTVSNNLTIGGVGTTALGELYGPLIGSFAASSQTAVVSGSVTLSSDALISTWASGGVTGSKLSLTGPVNIGSNTLTLTRRVTAAASTSTEVNGVIAGTGSVIVNGSATVYLNGVNTYTGTTTVQSGVLGGNGTIAGAVVVENGTIAPGQSASALDTLTVGSLELGSGATAAFTISDLVNYDRIVSNGTVDFGSTEAGVTVDFLSNGFAPGSMWQLFSGTIFTGHLSSFTISGSYGTPSPTFTYAAGEWSADIGEGNTMHFYESGLRAGQLVVVPEPSTIVFAGIGLFVLGWRRLAKRRRAARSTADAIAAV